MFRFNNFLDPRHQTGARGGAFDPLTHGVALRNGSSALRRRATRQTSGWKAFLLCCGLWKEVSAARVWRRRRLVLRRRGMLEADPGVGERGRRSVGRWREPWVLQHFFWHRSLGCLVRHHALEQVGHLDAKLKWGTCACMCVTFRVGSCSSVVTVDDVAQPPTCLVRSTASSAY